MTNFASTSLNNAHNIVDNQTQMQMYQKDSIDARDLPTIWAGLSAGEQEELYYALLTAKCAKTRQAIWNWMNGKRRPTSPIVRDEVARRVSKVIGARCVSATLFPVK